MRIDNIQGKNIQKLYQNQQNLLNKENKQTSRSEGDKMNISSKGLQIKKLADQLESDPGIRAEKVARLKQEIADGNYHIDSEKLAESLMNEIELTRGDL